MIRYDQVDSILAERFKSFSSDSLNEGLAYLVAADFSRYLCKCYKSGKQQDLQNGFDFIEALLTDGDEKAKELAVTGYLEGIQKWESEGVELNRIFDLLGPASQLAWKSLIKSWEKIDELKFEKIRKELYESERDYFLRTGKKYPTNLSLDAEEHYRRISGKESRFRYSEKLERLYRGEDK